MALQPGTSLEEQYANINKQYVGLDRREKLQQLRNPDRLGTETSWKNTGPSNTFRGSSGSRYAGFKELNQAPELDSDTKQVLRPIVGDYTEGGQRQAGYYGNYNPYDRDQAFQYTSSIGLKPTKEMYDAELESVFGKIPKVYGQAMLGKDAYDVTVAPERDQFLKTLGYTNVTGQTQPEFSWMPGYSSGLNQLKGQTYSKSALPQYQAGDTGYQRRTRDDGYSYDILDSTGKSLGVGYYGIEDALKNILTSTAPKKVVSYTEPDQTNDIYKVLPDWASQALPEQFRPKQKTQYAINDGMYGVDYTTPLLRSGLADTFNVPTYSSSKEAEDAWLQKQMDTYSKADTNTEQLEYLSQLFDNPTLGLSNAHGGTSEFNNIRPDSSMSPLQQVEQVRKATDFSPDQYAKHVAPKIKSVGDTRDYSFTGEKAMIGSQPIIDKNTGTVVGYTNSSTYNPTSWSADVRESYKTGPKLDSVKNAFNYSGAGVNYVTPNDSNWYKQNAVNTGQNSYYIPSDLVSSNPGYTSKDAYAGAISDYEKSQGFLSTLGKMGTAAVLGSAFGAAGGALMGGSAGQAIGSSIPNVVQGVAQGQPLGSVLKGAGINALGSWLGSAYGQDLGSALGGQELSKELGGSLIKAGVGAAGGALGGGGARGALATGLGSLGGDIAGLGIGELAGSGDFGKYIGNIGGGAVRTGLSDYIRTGELNMDNIGMAAASQGIAGLGNLFLPVGGTTGEERKNRINIGNTTQSLANLGSKVYKQRKA